MSPSTSVSEVTQDQPSIQQVLGLYKAARTNGTLPMLADGLQFLADAERKVAEMEATAAPVAASKGTKRVHLIKEAQSDDEQRASKTRSRKSTRDTTEGPSPAAMDAKDGSFDLLDLGVAARKSTHEDLVAEHGASAKAIESSEPFPEISERIPEKVQRPLPRRSKEQTDALVQEALALFD